jgi:ankyrin repeat protein
VDPIQELTLAFKAGDAARFAAILESHPELKSRLNDPFPGGAFGATPLLAAVGTRSREMIDALLHAGADINARSHWWAGSFGVLDNDSGLEPFLIERGAIVDAHAAARLGMLDRLRTLVDADPSLVHARGGDGQTPLHFARNVEVAEYLLEHGADIDARDIDHEGTPAQYMVRDRQDVARFLVARGCDTDILMASVLGDLDRVHRHLDADAACIRMSVTEEWFPKKDPRAGGIIYIWTLGANQTPLMVAREFGHTEIFDLLMQRSPASLQLAVACEIGDEALVGEVLAAHPDAAREVSDLDRRKLVDAAQNNNTAAVRLMLEAGWPPDARGQHRGTALHWACYHGNLAMVRELVRHGAPLDAKGDDFDGTPMDWAVHGSEHGWYSKTGDYAGTIQALKAAGAKPSEP